MNKFCKNTFNIIRQYFNHCRIQNKTTFDWINGRHFEIHYRSSIEPTFRIQGSWHMWEPLIGQNLVTCLIVYKEKIAREFSHPTKPRDSLLIKSEFWFKSFGLYDGFCFYFFKISKKTKMSINITKYIWFLDNWYWVSNSFLWIPIWKLQKNKLKDFLP